ncbi:MAG TPA: hypothetical protein PLP82_06060 [Deltaproteobacteria bacterium]|nr:hypothetical protein [Deltaproteobacteria bacterium]
MKRPKLNEIPIDPEILGKPGVNITMMAGQWDELLRAGYDAGCTLIEIDGQGIPTRAYRKDREEL